MDKNIIQKAVNAYNDSTALLESIFTTFKKIQNDAGGDFDVRVAMNRYDALLQYSMMQVALKDGTLCEEEVKFIMSLTKYCDLCDYLNQRDFEGVNWQVLYNTDENVIANVLKQYEADMLELNKEFISIFASIDFAIPDHDFVAELRNYAGIILTSVAAADNNIKQEEFAPDSLIMIAIAAIEELKSRASSGNLGNVKQQNIDEKPRKKSLKDFFVKKN